MSRRFVDSLNSISSIEAKQTRQAEVITIINFVKKIRRLLILSFLIVAISYVAYGITFSSLDQNISPGDFNYVAFIIDIASVGLALHATVVAWYVNSVSVGPIVAETLCSYPCSIFHYWDRMNKHLIPEHTSVNITSKETTVQI